ncbi:hypothetical protein E8K88_16295 [Lampropedia aestuarii]|uniref:Uncharacterized protein n=1 Tax=Lampropedia aestuarii TaxID=2562762 RepID=A0A4S5BJL5_9BURK|nr:hypothetical protein [Lampropedia aestuarii]THJ31025.1 hypothetical protein E8K88_16295 [Lampropedia aestuarii]
MMNSHTSIALLATPGIFYFDRVKIRANHADIDLHNIARARKNEATIRFHREFKCNFDLLQPGEGELRALELATRLSRVEVAYVEFALDVLWAEQKDADWLKRELERSIVIKHLGADTRVYIGEADETTRYFGKLLGQKKLVIYSDRPLRNVGQEYISRFPFRTHIEFRVRGAPQLTSLGIRTIRDLLNFDHERLFRDLVHVPCLPSKKKDLGALVRKHSQRSVEVSDRMLTNAANQWLQEAAMESLNAKANTDSQWLKRIKRVDLLEWLTWKCDAQVRSRNRL